MYRWLRRRKSDILVIATLVTIFILMVYENTGEDLPDTRRNRPANARNVGRYVLIPHTMNSHFRAEYCKINWYYSPSISSFHSVLQFSIAKMYR